MFKSWWKSKTVWGLIISAMGGVLDSIGIEIDREARGVLAEQIVNLIPHVMEVGGLIFAGYGRVKATGGITFKNNKKKK